MRNQGIAGSNLDGRVALRSERSSIVFRGLACLVLGKAILLTGCGGSGTAGSDVPKTETEARFKGLQKLGEGHTQQALADAMKKAGVVEKKVKKR